MKPSKVTYLCKRCEGDFLQYYCPRTQFRTNNEIKRAILQLISPGRLHQGRAPRVTLILMVRLASHVRSLFIYHSPIPSSGISTQTYFYVMGDRIQNKARKHLQDNMEKTLVTIWKQNQGGKHLQDNMEKTLVKIWNQNQGGKHLQDNMEKTLV